jgi:DNA-binding NarL/FixJ family response regulator
VPPALIKDPSGEESQVKSDEGGQTMLTASNSPPIRVVLAEDSFIVREGIEQILATASQVEIVAVCGDMDSLLEAVDRLAPAVVLTDIRMPPTNSDEGIRIADLLRRRDPRIGVVVLSQYSEPHYVLRLLDAGIEGRAYLLKERVHNRKDLVGAISSVADSGSVIDPKVVEVLVQARARAERSPLTDLTPREIELLTAVAEGKSNAAIAEDFVLSKRAVEKHITGIFLKLGLSHASEQDEISKRVMAVLMFLADKDLLSHQVKPQASSSGR